MKKRKALTILFSLFICGIATVCGFFMGNKINSKYFSLYKNLNIDPNTLKDDVTKIQYEGKTPNELSATDCFLVAFSKLETLNYYKKTLVGTIETSVGVQQSTHSESIKNGDTFSQSFCTYSSMVKIAGKTCFKENEDIVITHGSAQSKLLNDVAWSDKTTTYSFDEYSSLLGRSPIDESTYLISSKTVQNASACEINEDNYTYTIILNPTLSTILYKNEIAYRTGIDINTINFISLQIKFTLNKNFTILYQEVTEEYSMKYAGLNVTAYTNFKINFEY